MGKSNSGHKNISPSNTCELDPVVDISKQVRNTATTGFALLLRKQAQLTAHCRQCQQDNNWSPKAKRSSKRKSFWCVGGWRIQAAPNGAVQSCPHEFSRVRGTRLEVSHGATHLNHMLHQQGQCVHICHHAFVEVCTVLLLIIVLQNHQQIESIWT